VVASVECSTSATSKSSTDMRIGTPAAMRADRLAGILSRSDRRRYPEARSSPRVEDWVADFVLLGIYIPWGPEIVKEPGPVGQALTPLCGHLIHVLPIHL